ncbi:MAG TPA: hypothetical protein VN750_13495 [Steroidobacteraceae bacterium]|nr:hypothetical protein [Steroidobacteraceae bacterium]
MSLSGIPVLRALAQSPAEVVVRRPGQRFLSAPLPIAPYAASHWEFAWLSLAAYGATPAARKRAAREAHKSRARTAPDGTPLAPRDPIAILGAAGWDRWPPFGRPSVWQQIEDAHLRVEVWESRARGAVAVAFGGTVFNNEKDWLSNLRWFVPDPNDEYTQVVRTFVGSFCDEYRRRFPGNERPAVFSTGHSLGGGLAQQFAYALPLEEGVPRIKAVYAFDPSPVTGYFSVPRALRDENKRNLFIDRVYERGEILALVRSLLNLIYATPAHHPAIRSVRYSLFYGWNPLAEHSIVQLANKIDREVAAQPSGGAAGAPAPPL